jgi:hypothetical protein
MLSRMCAVVSFVVPILENLAARCAVSALFYIREVAEDGSVLAGVELEFLGEDVAATPRRRFFWSSVWCGCTDAYDQAAVQAIRFLQGIYGFVVRDYNYDSMLAYRESMRSAVVVAASAARHASYLDMSVSAGCVDRPQFDWHLVCSRLLASARNI